CDTPHPPSSAASPQTLAPHHPDAPQSPASQPSPPLLRHSFSRGAHVYSRRSLRCIRSFRRAPGIPAACAASETRQPRWQPPRSWLACVAACWLLGSCGYSGLSLSAPLFDTSSYTPKRTAQPLTGLHEKRPFAAGSGLKISTSECLQHTFRSDRISAIARGISPARWGNWPSPRLRSRANRGSTKQSPWISSISHGF